MGTSPGPASALLMISPSAATWAQPAPPLSPDQPGSATKRKDSVSSSPICISQGTGRCPSAQHAAEAARASCNIKNLQPKEFGVASAVFPKDPNWAPEPGLFPSRRGQCQQGMGYDVHLPVMSIFWSLRMAEFVQVIKLIILIKNVPCETVMHLSACIF